MYSDLAPADGLEQVSFTLAEELKALVAAGDTFRLIFRLRGGLARGQFGLCHEGLFNRAFAGTKVRVRISPRAAPRCLPARSRRLAVRAP